MPKIQNLKITLTPSLISSQKEADKKILLHAKLLVENANHNTTIRSLSVDNDIVILIIFLLWKFKELVILDDGQRKTEKSLGKFLE